ncbi:MAG: HlyD family efflux transporter periplasmic adaptor subunit, partial [Actinobacteria bacterium]|nr:HlyD family efflux transporter periplasmic adaptor subunit [Actinomycetota bacterium]
MKTHRLGLVAVIAVLALTGCGGNQDTGIETGSVITSSVSESVEAAGSISAKAVVTISSPASGTIGQLFVRDGQKVRRGQKLLVISSPSTQKQLKQAQSAAHSSSVSIPTPTATPVANALAQADSTAKAAFDAAQTAIDALPVGAAKTQAQTALAQAKAQYALARAQVNATTSSANDALTNALASISQLVNAQGGTADLAVSAARDSIKALTIRAPISGIVTFDAVASASSSGASGVLSQLPSSLQGLASSVLGSGGGSSASASGSLVKGLPVSSGQTLLTLTDVAGLTLTTQVDETDILLVKAGIKANVQLDAVPDANYQGRVTSVGVTPSTSSRGGVSYVVRLSFGSGTTADGLRAPRPLPGMSAVAQLQVRTDRAAISVPASAVFRDLGSDSVWIVVDGVAKKRVVRLGAQGADTIA